MPTQTTNAPSGVECPKCGAANMWDNRATKKNPKAPDYKCRDRSCDGVIWPPKDARANGNGGRQTSESQTGKQQPVHSGDLPGDPSQDVDFATLCTRYRECVGYVVKQIVPALAAADIGVAPESVASMAATLFIARNQRGV